MTRYLVTGGAGFIGSNIVEELVRRGASVRVADNFSTGRIENLSGLADRVELLTGDLAELDFARHAMRDVDYVLHLAAIPSVPRSVADPLANNRAGVVATLNVLVAARDAGVKRMTYASSSSIYGEAQDANSKSEAMLPAPLSPYGVSKLAAEQYCMSFHAVYGFEAVALRYFNVFGPRQNPDSEYAAVIPRFVMCALERKAATVFGDGGQTRDFTYVGNIVDANLHALTHPAAPGQIFNIAMGTPHTLNDVLGMLREITGNDVAAHHTAGRVGDIRHSCANVEKARQMLQFTPSISFREGLEKATAWYRAQAA